VRRSAATSSLSAAPDDSAESVSVMWSARHTALGAFMPRVTNQGLTLVHFSAQPEPYLTRNATCTPPNTPRHLLNTRKTTPKQSLNAPPIPQKALTLSRKVHECKPLP